MHSIVLQFFFHQSGHSRSSLLAIWLLPHCTTGNGVRFHLPGLQHGTFIDFGIYRYKTILWSPLGSLDDRELRGFVDGVDERGFADRRVLCSLWSR